MRICAVFLPYFHGTTFILYVNIVYTHTDQWTAVKPGACW